MAAALSDRGAIVALLARGSVAPAKFGAAASGQLARHGDMTRFDSVRQAVRTVHEHYGRVHGLVNNAGRSYPAAVEEIEPALFDASELRLPLRSCFF